MCLLIAMFQVAPDAPLIVAANRDERLDRPAVPMTVLREHGPRILGGRDELAGGTWLAVNEHGVVAGLTNQPSADGRDPTKRSRGELPLAFAAYRSATEAVAGVRAELDPAVYNPCWMLVGDREALFSIGISGGSEAEVAKLAPGLHVLENAPLQSGSAKAAFVRGLVADALAKRRADDTAAGRRTDDAAATVSALEVVLGDHQPAVPEPRTDAT
ncbi:MAG TPA: NRDE family protein, partial [Streptosporangiaceae bacterium]